MELLAIIIVLIIIYYLYIQTANKIPSEPHPVLHHDDGRIIIKWKGNRYDVTKFVIKHPGGREIIVENNGKEVSELMESHQHSSVAYRMLDKYRIQ